MTIMKTGGRRGLSASGTRLDQRHQRREFLALAGGYQNKCCGGSVATTAGCFCPLNANQVQLLIADETACGEECIIC